MNITITLKILLQMNSVIQQSFTEGFHFWASSRIFFIFNVSFPAEPQARISFEISHEQYLHALAVLKGIPHEQYELRIPPLYNTLTDLRKFVEDFSNLATDLATICGTTVLQTVFYLFSKSITTLVLQFLTKVLQSPLAVAHWPSGSALGVEWTFLAQSYVSFLLLAEMLCDKPTHLSLLFSSRVVGVTTCCALGRCTISLSNSPRYREKKSKR